MKSARVKPKTKLGIFFNDGWDVEGRMPSTQISALGSFTNSNGVSLENSATTTSSTTHQKAFLSGFSFRYPLLSLWRKRKKRRVREMKTIWWRVKAEEYVVVMMTKKLRVVDL